MAYNSWGMTVAQRLHAKLSTRLHLQWYPLHAFHPGPDMIGGYWEILWRIRGPGRSYQLLGTVEPDGDRFHARAQLPAGTAAGQPMVYDRWHATLLQAVEDVVRQHDM